MGLKVPILDLYKLKELKQKLALDATASIGLEKDHHYSMFLLIALVKVCLVLLVLAL